MKHLIGIEGFMELDEALDIVDAARKWMPHAENKIRPRGLDIPDTAKVTILMAEPSTRTSGSYRQAAALLGFRVQEISGAEATSMMKGESLADTVRTLATQGADVIVMRTKFEGGAQFAAEILDSMGCGISIQNAGDGGSRHPSQALLNLLALECYLKRHHAFTYGAVGDLRYSRTLNSDLEVFFLLQQRYGDIKIVAVSAPETRIQTYRKLGLDIIEGDTLELLRQCDVVGATRIQKERFVDKHELARVIGRYIINRRVVDEILKPDVLLMHPGPRCEEIAPDISQDPHLIMWKQMFGGVPTRMVLLMRGYEGRKTKSAVALIKMPRVSIKEEEPTQVRLARRKERGEQDTYFRPIYERGTIIDHLPHGSVDTLKRLLKQHGLAGEGCIHALEGIKNQGTGVRKDVIVLEGRHVPESLFAAVRFIAPKATFNVITDSMFRKLAVDVEGSSIGNGIFKCPNDVCITNNDPEAQSRFTIGEGGQEVICDYCQRPFSREEMVGNFG